MQRLLQRAPTEGRDDDTEDVIRRRQEVYAEQTAPLLDTYAGRGLLVEVDGMGEVDEVTARVFAALRVRPRTPRPAEALVFRERGIEIKTPEQIDKMRAAGLVVGETLELLRGSVRAGMTTAELDASPRRTSAPTARSRRSRATTASRPRSASRSTTRWCTASPATG